MENKWIFRSKTIWTNLLILVVLYFLVGQSRTSDIANEIGTSWPTILAVANLILRYFSTNTGLDEKNPLRSKTLWLNFAVIVYAVFLLYSSGDMNAALILGGIGIVNILLRFVTNKGVSLVPSFG